MANQLGPGGKGLTAVREQTKPRLPFVGCGLSTDRAAEAGVRRRQGWLSSRGTSRLAQPLRNEASISEASKGCLKLT